jgi:hypothetical protein
MHQHYPNISITPGGPDKVRECLAEVLPELWKREIEGEFLESLWKSMPQRVLAAVIEAEDWYTNIICRTGNKTTQAQIEVAPRRHANIPTDKTLSVRARLF